MRKEDHKLKLKEYKYLIKQLDIRTFLTIKKQYQCGNCLHTFSKQETCPKCGTVKNRGISIRNKSYERYNWFQVFRKSGKDIISLLFMIYDDKNSNEIRRNIYLVRKIIYNKDMKTVVNVGLYYNQLSNQMRYSGAYDNRFYPPYPGALKYKVPAYSIIYDKKLLNELPEFKYCDIPDLINDIESTIKFPRIIEMLQKYSKRDYIYSGIRTIAKHPKSYKKYHKYFEQYNEFKANVLIQLSKYNQMLEYKDFERLMKIAPLPKSKTFQDLIDCSKLMKNERYFNNQIYKDYLRMAKESGLDITLNSVRFNSNWRKEHDRIMNMAKLEKAQLQEKDFKKAYQGFKDFVKKGIYIVVPTAVKDLFDEGDILDHCVSGYVDRVARGELMIFFIREEHDLPFVTVEIQNNKIVQMRGIHNHIQMIKPIHRTIMKEYISAHG